VCGQLGCGVVGAQRSASPAGRGGRRRAAAAAETGMTIALGSLPGYLLRQPLPKASFAVAVMAPRYYPLVRLTAARQGTGIGFVTRLTAAAPTTYNTLPRRERASSPVTTPSFSCT